VYTFVGTDADFSTFCSREHQHIFVPQSRLWLWLIKAKMLELEGFFM